MKLLVVLTGLLLCVTALASPPIDRNWSYVKIESDSISVEMRTDKRGRKIEMLHVIQDGKFVEISDIVYERVETPQINKLRIVACLSTDNGSCSILHLPYINQGDDVPIENAFKELVIEFIEGQMVRYWIVDA